MKKLFLCAGLFVSAALCASQVIVETPVHQTHELVSGTAHTIALGNGIELRVVDMGDVLLSVFTLTVMRATNDGVAMAPLCENQLKVPFGSNATLVFSKLGVSITFVASVPTATVAEPQQTSDTTVPA